jgi:hypothetical protein
MPNPPTTVTLTIKNGAPPDNTWNVLKDQAGNDLGFCYQFTGGNWSAVNGGGPGYFQAITDQGNLVVTVKLDVEGDLIWRGNNPQSYGFRFAGMKPDPDPNGQLTWNGDAADVGTITDVATQDVADSPGDSPADYTILLDYKPSATAPPPPIVSDIPCHPGWRNTGGDGGV